MARKHQSSQRLADVFSLFAPAFLKWQYAGVLVEGMTYPRMRLIHQLAEDGPLMMNVLSERLNVSARNITVLVDGLEKDSLVRRVSHPTDRRATLIEITDEGKRIHKRIYAVQDEQTALLALLDKLRVALMKSSDAEGRPLELDFDALRK